MADDFEQLRQLVQADQGVNALGRPLADAVAVQPDGAEAGIAGADRVGVELVPHVPAKKLSMNVATIPPGGVAYAHIHVDFDVMLYILQGRVRHEYGPGLKKVVENEAGDFIYIEPGVPHEVFNMSVTEPVVAVVARSDASEWENIIPYNRNSDG